jgi:hypothetical protein
MQSNVLTQVFNSPNVNLEIKSFKSMKFWEEMMESAGLKNIWDFIEWIMPRSVFNIHNFFVIKERFVGTPSNDRIFDFLRDDDRYYSIVNINLHNPAKGCHITVYEVGEVPVKANYKPDTFIYRDGNQQFSVQNYVDPNTERSISLLNQFNFYEIFSKYIAMGNANNGQRTFTMTNGPDVFTDKNDICFYRDMTWKGVRFESTIPTRGKDRSIYHSIGEAFKSSKNVKGFFESFHSLHAHIDRYITSANNDKVRIGNAEGFKPICYSKADYIMRELRYRFARLSLERNDFDQTFTPYLEIGEGKCNFTYGVITR